MTAEEQETKTGEIAETDEPAATTDTGPAEDAALTRDTAAEDRSGAEPLAPLLDPDRATDYRSRWESLQPRFVDDPRATVEEANDLVKKLLQDLETGFDETRSTLEGQWSEDEDVSTEDLRRALQRYGSFFERLLAV